MNQIKLLWQRMGVRRLVYVLAIGLVWQLVYLSGRFPQMLFPSVPDIIQTLVRELLDGSMIVKVLYSLRLIFVGLALSCAMALVFTLISMLSKTFKDLMRMFISIFDPLPGIALIPLSILWFGIGDEAIIFVMVHSILWPMLLNIITGFDSVPSIYTEVGRSFGLKPVRLTCLIYAPASLPSIMTGFKTGWARAWRALISAEMVFGASGSTGGIGWDIYTKRSYLDMPGMFASLIVIMVIGILVEDIFFRQIELRTLYKWGVVK